MRSGGHRNTVGFRSDDGERIRRPVEGQGARKYGERPRESRPRISAARSAKRQCCCTRAGGYAREPGRCRISPPAGKELGHLGEPIDSDVLICGDDPKAVETVSEIVGKIPGCRPLDAGELSNATAIEAFTAVLLQLNVRYRTRVAPKLTGIRDASLAN